MHQIEINGDKASMAYFGQLPWHGLGTPLDEGDLYDWPSASVKAGLNWEAELVPLVTADTGAKFEHRAVRRKTDSRSSNSTVYPRAGAARANSSSTAHSSARRAR